MLHKTKKLAQDFTQEMTPLSKVIFNSLIYLVMSDMKSLVKNVTRCNKKEHSQSRSIERKFKRQINRYQANFTKMGYMVESTSKEIKEE